mgnify:CR=1 FL=1
MADKKFLDAMTKKFKEAPEEKTTTFYNMGGWTQSERKTEFVNEGKAIAEKRGIPMYNPDIGNPLGQRALMSYQLSGTDTFVEGDDLHFINNAAMQQAWDDIRKTVIVGLNTAHNVLEKRLGMEVTPEMLLILNSARQEFGLSEEKMSVLMEMDIKTFRQLESGEKNTIKISQWEKLEFFLNLPEDRRKISIQQITNTGNENNE